MENQFYYEGILQLRDCTDEAVDFAVSAIEKEPGVRAAKILRVKGGVDIYVSSNRFLKILGRMLSEKFTGIKKETSKLFTRDRQSFKNVYRGTVLFRMAGFEKGDIGDFKGENVEVMSVGNRVEFRNSQSGKKGLVKFDDFKKGFRKPIC